MAKPLVSIEIMRAAAVEFLRYDRACKLVCLERSPFDRDACVPDVLGVTKSNRVVEIEIKRTLADFKKNREKTSMFHRQFMGIAPSMFYFMIPQSLEAKVLPLLDPKEGLLVIGEKRSVYSKLPCAMLVRQAPVYKESKPLKIKEIVRMVAHQTGTLSSALVKLARHFDEQPLVEPEE